MSKAVSRSPIVSATISVVPSGVITDPFGNFMSGATACTVPSGSTRANVAFGGPGSASTPSTPCSRMKALWSKPKFPT